MTGPDVLELLRRGGVEPVYWRRKWRSRWHRGMRIGPTVVRSQCGKVAGADGGRLLFASFDEPWPEPHCGACEFAMPGTEAVRSEVRSARPGGGAERPASPGRPERVAPDVALAHRGMLPSNSHESASRAFFETPASAAGIDERDRTMKTPQDCACGCGEQTKGGRFRPGHDAKLASRLRKEAAAEVVIEQLPPIDEPDGTIKEVIRRRTRKAGPKA